MKEYGSFSMDWKDFDKKFFEYALKTAPEAAEKGIWEALRELKSDADNVPPRTPHLEGNLRGDYTLILEGITQSKIKEVGSQHKGGGVAAERHGAKSIIAKIVFRMPYAARWHEAVGKKVNWSEAGVGSKFLESKMSMFAKKYFNIVASAIKAITGK